MRHNHTSQYRDATDYIATIAEVEVAVEVEVEVEVEEEVKEKVEVELEVWRRRRRRRRRSRKGGIKWALENSSTNSYVVSTSTYLSPLS